MWHYKVVFMLPNVVGTSGVNSNQLESVHQKWRFKTQPSTQVQLFVSNHKRFIWLPTRGIQVVTLQVQEVQLQVVAIDLHMANFIWFRPFLWSLMTKGERNEQRYELSFDDKGGDEMRVRSWTWIKRINILVQEEHISRGSKLMNLVAYIWYVHIHVLTCICISFKIYICIACVWCMLVIELDCWFDN